jgi:hypothetical protein
MKIKFLIKIHTKKLKQKMQKEEILMIYMLVATKDLLGEKKHKRV